MKEHNEDNKLIQSIKQIKINLDFNEKEIQLDSQKATDVFYKWLLLLDEEVCIETDFIKINFN